MISFFIVCFILWWLIFIVCFILWFYNFPVNTIFNIVNEYNLADFNSNVMLLYEAYNTKLSFTDSSIIYIMKEEGIDNLLSFDNEFKKVDSIKLIGL